MEPVAVLLAAIGGFLMWGAYKGLGPKATLQDALNGKTPSGTATGTTTAPAAAAAAPKKTAAAPPPAAAASKKAAGPQVGEILPHLPTANVKELNADFASKLAAMISAARQAGFTITVISGYRSSTKQAELFDAAVKKYGSTTIARKWVAPPGHSMHEKGLAADLSFSGTGLVNSENATTRWAHSNAGTYGLTFPLSNELWHVEPIGAR